MEDLSDVFVLRNGVGVPCVGFGTAQLPPGGAAVSTILEELEEGCRHLDTAMIHQNEESIAKALEESDIPREHVFITVKLRNEDRSYDGALRAFSRALGALRTDYIDLFMIHWPAQPMDGDWQQINCDTWRALETLYDRGSVRAIGVSNFKPHQLEELECTVAPMVNQIEFRPGFIQRDTMRYCKDHDILIEAWGPLSSRKLVRSPALQQIAERYDRTVPQIILRWCLQHDAVPLIRAGDGEHLSEDASIFQFELSPEDMRKIDRAS